MSAESDRLEQVRSARSERMERGEPCESAEGAESDRAAAAPVRWPRCLAWRWARGTWARAGRRPHQYYGHVA
jgi:hypothetical protein